MFLCICLSICLFIIIFLTKVRDSTFYVVHHCIPISLSSNFLRPSLFPGVSCRYASCRYTLNFLSVTPSFLLVTCHYLSIRLPICFAYPLPVQSLLHLISSNLHCLKVFLAVILYVSLTLRPHFYIWLTIILPLSFQSFLYIPLLSTFSFTLY